MRWNGGGLNPECEVSGEGGMAPGQHSGCEISGKVECRQD